MGLKQVYNSRSKKWVLYDDAKRSGIIKMQSEPFDGIEKNGKSTGGDGKEDKPGKVQNVTDRNFESEQKPEVKEEEKGLKNEEEFKPKESDESPGGWFSVLGF